MNKYSVLNVGVWSIILKCIITRGVKGNSMENIWVGCIAFDIIVSGRSNCNTVTVTRRVIVYQLNIMWKTDVNSYIVISEVQVFYSNSGSFKDHNPVDLIIRCAGAGYFVPVSIECYAVSQYENFRLSQIPVEDRCSGKRIPFTDGGITLTWFIKNDLLCEYQDVRSRD